MPLVKICSMNLSRLSVSVGTQMDRFIDSRKRQMPLAKNTFHEYEPIERTCWNTNESFYRLQKALNTSHKNNQRADKLELEYKYVLRVLIRSPPQARKNMVFYSKMVLGYCMMGGVGGSSQILSVLSLGPCRFYLPKPYGLNLEFGTQVCSYIESKPVDK